MPARPTRLALAAAAAAALAAAAVATDPKPQQPDNGAAKQAAAGADFTSPETFTQAPGWTRPARPARKCKCPPKPKDQSKESKTAADSAKPAVNRRAGEVAQKPPSTCDCPPMTNMPPGMKAKANAGAIMSRLVKWDRPRPMRKVPDGCPEWLQSAATIKAKVEEKVTALQGKTEEEVLTKLGQVLGDEVPAKVLETALSARGVKDQAGASAAQKAAAAKLLDMARRITAMDELREDITASNATQCVRKKPKRGEGKPRRFKATLAAGKSHDDLKTKLNEMTGLPKENIEVTVDATRRADAGQAVSVEFTGNDAGYASSVVDYMSADEQAALGLGSVTSQVTETLSPASAAGSLVVSVAFTVAATACALLM